jgi:hypothetical protein
MWPLKTILYGPAVDAGSLFAPRPNKPQTPLFCAWKSALTCPAIAPQVNTERFELQSQGVIHLEGA